METRLEPLLEVSHIDALHGSFQALWDVSLSVAPLEIVAMIGANGSGKSTLLDTISGLLHPAGGTIEYEGRDISRMKPFQIVGLGISQVPEGRRVFPELTVLENLEIGSYNRGARSEKDLNLQRVFHLFPLLKGKSAQLAKMLSGGMQQMLAVGRGLMSNPRLLLLDEISLGLAPLVVNELYLAMKEIRKRGITILFVEQNVRRSLSEADRAYILEGGRVALNGPTKELQEEEKVKKAYFGA